MQDERAAVDKLRSEVSIAMDEQGEPLKALALLGEADRLLRSIKEPPLSLPVLDVKARLLVKLRQLDKALECLNEIERICRESGMTVVQSLLDTKARLLVVLGRSEEALYPLMQAERTCKESGDLKGVADILAFRIEILSKLGRLEEAVIQTGRQLTAEGGQMPSDGGLPPDYWEEREDKLGC